MAQAKPSPPHAAPGPRARRRPGASRILVLTVVAAMLTVGVPGIAFAQSSATQQTVTQSSFQSFLGQLLAFFQSRQPVTPPTAPPTGEPTAAPDGEDPDGEDPDGGDDAGEDPTEVPTDDPTAPPAEDGDDGDDEDAGDAPVARIIGTAVDNLEVDPDTSTLAENCDDTGLDVSQGGVDLIGETSCLELSVVVRADPVVTALRNLTVDGGTVTAEPQAVDLGNGQAMPLDAFTVDPAGGAGDTLYRDVDADGDLSGHCHFGVVDLDAPDGLPQTPTYRVFSAVQSLDGDAPVELTVENLPPGDYRMDYWCGWGNHTHFVADSANTTISMDTENFSIGADGADEDPAAEGDAGEDQEAADQEAADQQEDPDADGDGDQGDGGQGDGDRDGDRDGGQGDGDRDGGRGDGDGGQGDGDGAEEAASPAPTATPTVSLTMAGGDTIAAPHQQSGVPIGGGHAGH